MCPWSSASISPRNALVVCAITIGFVECSRCPISMRPWARPVGITSRQRCSKEHSDGGHTLGLASGQRSSTQIRWLRILFQSSHSLLEKLAEITMNNWVGLCDAPFWGEDFWCRLPEWMEKVTLKSIAVGYCKKHALATAKLYCRCRCIWITNVSCQGKGRMHSHSYTGFSIKRISVRAHWPEKVNLPWSY